MEFKRKLGYQLGGEGKELLLFARYADQTGHKEPVTTEIAVRWAKLPQSADPVYWARRYEVVRRFAKNRFLFDSRTEIPPKRLLGSSKRQLSPLIYSDGEIAALLQAASFLKPVNSLHPRTYVTLFGLLLSTGLRISEALNLSREDVDLKTNIITVTRTKFKKSRLVPISSSTSQALQDYLVFRDACYPGAKAEGCFISKKGISLNYRQVLYVFMKLRLHLGWVGKGKRSPRIHDFRHTFAVNRLLKWISEGKNLDRKIFTLSVYLGHARVTDTYWYLRAVPALLAEVSKRLENFVGRDCL
ncbi:tyrosine-type recombinase/integrase [bacterium]|nr:tyrosine-type recombinase/integrase [bacterium]